MEDFSEKHEKSPNPKLNANLFSLLTFWYTIPTYLQNIKTALTEDDIYETLPEHCSDTLGSLALNLWTKEMQKCQENKKTSLLIKVLIKLFGRDYLRSFIALIIVEVGARIYMAVALGNFVESYGNENRQTIYISAFSMICCAFIYLPIYHQYYFMCANSGLKMQIVCSTLIYNKILKLSKTALIQNTPGQIIILLSNDLTPFQGFFNLSHYLCIVPLQTIIVLYLTYREIGISSAIGTSLIFLFIPLHYLSAKLIAKHRTKICVSRDERIKLMNEIIHGIKTIKMYAWEKSFVSIIASYRKLEISSITKCLYLKEALSLHNVFIVTSLFVTVMSTVFFNTTLSVKNAFVIVPLYYTFGLNFMQYIPQGIACLQESKISIQRITKFLLNDEVQLNNYSKNTKHAVSIVYGSAKWNERSDQFTLCKISCNIKFHFLTAIIGSVGSGKSSLFHVILQELPLLHGTLNVDCVLSYCSQEPWIFSASVRNNILFGNKFDKERYTKVVKCCALEHDLKMFPYGDKTIVGERGALISGGQKTRINLARAIYKEADTYLLDDPLSAVDAHVGKQIFEDCIQTFLKNKTVIFITHQLQYLKNVDHVIVLENGEIIAERSPTDLETLPFNFVKYQQSVDKEEKIDPIDENPKTQSHDDATIKTPEVQTKTQTYSTEILTVYKDYILASKSYLYAVFVVCSFIVSQVLTSTSFWFICYWVKMEKQSHSDYDPQRKLNVYIYSGIIILTIAITIIWVILFVNLSMKSSEVLHNSMFEKVLRASLSFFNTNSSGRILNRFAKDLSIIDEILPNTSFTALRTLLTVLGILIVICVVNPWFIIPTAVAVVIIYFMRKVYLFSNLGVTRIESNARSPIYGHANTTAQGLATIRAFEVQQILNKEFNTFLDERSSAYFLYVTMSRSFAFFVDAICILYITTIILYLTLCEDTTEEKIGLAASQAFQLMAVVGWSIRQLADAEGFMVSVERILEYGSIQQESSPVCTPPTKWPELGAIKFTKVYLKYSDLEPYVLNNLNFFIEPQQKIGIVGRTGAGKSSIITALCQLVKNEGLITIDDIDVQKIGLQHLRNKMSIIPQDPVLFSGTVRKNLDPFDEFDDDVLWKAIGEVKLKNVINSMGSGLNSAISQNGSNLSVGQRQLICLARAIIRNNKILILDEATANVDLQTDEVIQETIRNNFINCTVLTIAHRLNTILGSDKVLVIHHGKVVEFDHPCVLLENKKGFFYAMVQNSKECISKIPLELCVK